MCPNPQETRNLVTFSEEILMENFIFSAVLEKPNWNQKTVADYSFSCIPETYPCNKNLRILRNMT